MLFLHLKEDLCVMSCGMHPHVGWGRSCAFTWVCEAVSGWLLYAGILYPGSPGSGKAGWVVTFTHRDHEMSFSLPFPDIRLLPPFLVSWRLPSFSPICFKWM